MRCTQVQGLLMRYASERLDRATARKVEAHLRACPLCRGEYEQEVELVAVFQEQVAETSAPGLSSAVMQQLAASRPPKRASRPALRCRPWRAVPVALATAAGLLGLQALEWQPVAHVAGSALAEAGAVLDPRAAWDAVADAGAETAGEVAIAMTGAAVPSLSGTGSVELAALTALAAVSCGVLVAAARRRAMEER